MSLQGLNVFISKMIMYEYLPYLSYGNLLDGLLSCCGLGVAGLDSDAPIPEIVVAEDRMLSMTIS